MDTAAMLRRQRIDPPRREKTVRRRKIKVEVDRGLHRLSLLHERAADHEPLYLARPFVDLAHAHIAINPLDRKIADITVTAMNLQRRRAHALGHLGRKQLRHRRLLET